jgi:curved DNA-binding protein CbpA
MSQNPKYQMKHHSKSFYTFYYQKKPMNKKQLEKYKKYSCILARVCKSNDPDETSLHDNWVYCLRWQKFDDLPDLPMILDGETPIKEKKRINLFIKKFPHLVYSAEKYLCVAKKPGGYGAPSEGVGQEYDINADFDPIVDGDYDGDYDSPVGSELRQKISSMIPSRVPVRVRQDIRAGVPVRVPTSVRTGFGVKTPSTVKVRESVPQYSDIGVPIYERARAKVEPIGTKVRQSLYTAMPDDERAVMKIQKAFKKRKMAQRQNAAARKIQAVHTARKQTLKLRNNNAASRVRQTRRKQTLKLRNNNAASRVRQTRRHPVRKQTLKLRNNNAASRVIQTRRKQTLKLRNNNAASRVRHTARKTLGVSDDATMKEIKSAYRRLALELHPDKSGGDTVKFMEVHGAFQQLRQNDFVGQRRTKLRRNAKQNDAIQAVRTVRKQTLKLRNNNAASRDRQTRRNMMRGISGNAATAGRDRQTRRNNARRNAVKKLQRHRRTQLKTRKNRDQIMSNYKKWHKNDPKLQKQRRNTFRQTEGFKRAPELFKQEQRPPQANPQQANPQQANPQQAAAAGGRRRRKRRKKTKRKRRRKR